MLLMNIPIGHVKTDSVDGDVGIRCSVVGLSGKCSKLGDHLGCNLWIEKLGLDTGYIRFGGRLCLIRSRVTRGIVVTDDDRANDGCGFLGALFR